MAEAVVEVADGGGVRCVLGGVTAYAAGAMWALGEPAARAGESVLVVMPPAWRSVVTLPIGVDPEPSPSGP
ncbi:hypothetical protein AB4Z14_19295 [Terrabacter sp. 2TAF16]|jgi:hypothetical protein|uniref:hypothetical protein n=1 Tax=Terrabacter sp. 2TAF16 TaxID=3233008 RepID=UPI003F9E3084